MSLVFSKDLDPKLNLLLIELERRLANVEGKTGKKISHNDLADTEDHSTFLKNDGSVIMQANLNLGRNRIFNSSNGILNADAKTGDVIIDEATNKLIIDSITNELIDDRVAALIQDGTQLTWTYSDAAGTLTGNVTQFANGELYEHDTPITIVWGAGDAGVSFPVTGLTAGISANITQSAANGTFTVNSGYAGRYEVYFGISGALNATAEIHSSIYLDTGAGYVKQENIATHRTIGAGSVYGDFGRQGHLDLSVGDVLRVEVESDTASRTLTIDHMNFNIKQISV